jgi:hypothetical protein
LVLSDIERPPLNLAGAWLFALGPAILALGPASPAPSFALGRRTRWTGCRWFRIPTTSSTLPIGANIGATRSAATATSGVVAPAFSAARGGRAGTEQHSAQHSAQLRVTPTEALRATPAARPDAEGHGKHHEGQDDVVDDQGDGYRPSLPAPVFEH